MHIHYRAVLIALAAVLVFAAPAAAAGACASKPYHQLDYLDGTWVAKNSHGIQGKLEAAHMLRGCALRLHWIGTRYEGYATHTYDATRDLWQKAWTDDTGSVAVSLGRVRDGVLTYEGVDYKNGRIAGYNRQTLRLLAGGTVKFTYATSPNRKVWTETPGLLYVRVSRPQFERLRVVEKPRS